MSKRKFDRRQVLAELLLRRLELTVRVGGDGRADLAREL